MPTPETLPQAKSFLPEIEALASMPETEERRNFIQDNLEDNGPSAMDLARTRHDLMERHATERSREKLRQMKARVEACKQILSKEKKERTAVFSVLETLESDLMAYEEEYDQSSIGEAGKAAGTWIEKKTGRLSTEAKNWTLETARMADTLTDKLARKMNEPERWKKWAGLGIAAGVPLVALLGLRKLWKLFLGTPKKTTDTSGNPVEIRRSKAHWLWKAPLFALLGGGAVWGAGKLFLTEEDYKYTRELRGK